jgi:hypothetical protein
MGQDVIDASLDANTDEGIKICRGDHAALVLLLGTMLDERVNRDNEESGGETEERQKNQDAGEMQAGHS